MDTPKNRFKAALLAGKTQIGLWSCLANPLCAEIGASAGFDWIMIDGEHAPSDLRSIFAQMQAVEPYATSPVVRPPVGDAIFLKQLMDAGAQTFLIPMVDTPEQARMLVEAIRYPPRGIRGIGAAAARAARWGRAKNYLHEADHEICLLVQIETRRGLENLEAIAAIDGVDGLFVGPADLSASLGHLGDWNHPEAKSAIDGAMKRIIAAGKPAGTLAVDEALAHRSLEIGCKFVAVGIDTMLLTNGMEKLVKQFKGDA